MSDIAAAVLATPAAAPAPTAPVTAAAHNASRVGVSEAQPAIQPAQPAAEPAPVTAVEQDKTAGRLAVLAKREAAAVKAQQAATAKETALAEREAKVAALEARELEFNRRLRDAGVDYDQLVKQPLTPEQQIARLREEVQQTEARRVKDAADAAAAAQKDATDKQAAAIEQFKTNINEQVADKTKYPLIGHFAQSSLVFDTIETHFNQTGKVMDIPEAAQLVESYLRRQVTESQALIAQPPEAKAPTAPAKRDPWKTSKPTTLTNASTAPSTTTAKPRWRSDDDRIKAALAKYASK